MESLTRNLLFRNWYQKSIALIAAVVIWTFVNQSITETVTLIGVPVRVTNLPPEKAIEGLLPNETLSKRLTLTLTGRRDAIDRLEESDLEVVLDASEATSDEWIVHIHKKNLQSLSPYLDISRDIKTISSQEFVIELDKLITAKIPIIVHQPTGKAPEGYELLGVWPQQFMQTVSGPKGIIQELHDKGVELLLNTSQIEKGDLDVLHSAQSGFYNDIVQYKVPDIWKKIKIPFLTPSLQEINDTAAEELRIDFLRKEYILLNRSLPIRVFYPQATIDTVNPEKRPLQPSGVVAQDHDIYLLDIPLLAYGVSRLFMDIVRDQIEITITAELSREGQPLPWSVHFINSPDLEEQYVAFLKHRYRKDKIQNREIENTREELWRNRFRKFMRELKLFVAPNQKLSLNAQLTDEGITIEKG